MTDPSAVHETVEGHGLRAVTDYLVGAGVPFEVVDHEPTETAAAEARAAHVPGDRMAKTVVVHDEATTILAVVPSDHRLDLDKLQSALGAAQRPHLASERELAAQFPQFDPGAVPPVGPMLVGATVVDARLLEHADVLCAGGDHRHAIRLGSQDLVRLAGARIADVSRDWSSGEPFLVEPR